MLHSTASPLLTAAYGAYGFPRCMLHPLVKVLPAVVLLSFYFLCYYMPYYRLLNFKSLNSLSNMYNYRYSSF